MPLYEYECPNPECKREIETIAHVFDMAPACPDCGAAMMKKISVTGRPRIR